MSQESENAGEVLRAIWQQADGQPELDADCSPTRGRNPKWQN